MNGENDKGNSQERKEEDNLRKEPSDLMLSYLSCPQDAANAFLGALMITDHRARPVHFSFVSPVRPTKVQRILYGSTLKEHVKIEVIGKKLLKDLPVIPDVLFVDVEDLLAIRQVADIPTAALSKSPEDESDPGRLSTLQYNTGSNIADQEVIGPIVAALETYVDLVEPFTRMKEALQEAIKSSDA